MRNSVCFVIDLDGVFLKKPNITKDSIEYCIPMGDPSPALKSIPKNALHAAKNITISIININKLIGFKTHSESALKTIFDVIKKMLHAKKTLTDTIDLALKFNKKENSAIAFNTFFNCIQVQCSDMLFDSLEISNPRFSYNQFSDVLIKQSLVKTIRIDGLLLEHGDYTGADTYVDGTSPIITRLCIKDKFREQPLIDLMPLLASACKNLKKLQLIGGRCSLEDFNSFWVNAQKLSKLRLLAWPSLQTKIPTQQLQVFKPTGELPGIKEISFRFYNSVSSFFMLGYITQLLPNLDSVSLYLDESCYEQLHRIQKNSKEYLQQMTTRPRLPKIILLNKALKLNKENAKNIKTVLLWFCKHFKCKMVLSDELLTGLKAQRIWSAGSLYSNFTSAVCYKPTESGGYSSTDEADYDEPSRRRPSVLIKRPSEFFSIDEPLKKFKQHTPVANPVDSSESDAPSKT